MKDGKLEVYAEHADKISTYSTAELDDTDSFLGRCNFASGIYLRIKQHMAELSRCRYMPNRLQEGRFPLSAKARADAARIAQIIRTNKGLPLMCDTHRPAHYDVTTVTHRADACLNEGVNGFGIYWVVPKASGGVAILALMDTWTPEEEALFNVGGGVPAAEACAALLGLRAVREHDIMQDHHEDLLQLSDSSTTDLKMSSLKIGAPVMDAIRDEWLVECGRLTPWNVSLEHIFREKHAGTPTKAGVFLSRTLPVCYQGLTFPPSPRATPLGTTPYTRASFSVRSIPACHPRFNVGSDLLSKQQWDLFVATILAAGLPEPIRISLSEANRDLSTVLACLRDS